MTTLFFKKPVALDREEHRNLRMKPVTDGYLFASKVNAVPITIAEISAASAEYPVVFALNPDGSGMPVVLLGVRDGENLFVDAQGRWDGYYVPGLVRCYPFALQQAPGRDDALVVIDAEYPGFGTEEGTPFFDENGGQGMQLQQTVATLQQFYHQEQTSLQFVSLLSKHKLLVSRKLEVNKDDGGTISLDGFNVVDEDRMLALDDAALLELARSGALGLVYAHINSLTSLHRMMARLNPRLLAERAAAH